MEDFDNDGLLDIAITTADPTVEMKLFHNTGTGTFDDISIAAGLAGQTSGLNCVQTDYNNDGLLDIAVTAAHAGCTLFIALLVIEFSHRRLTGFLPFAFSYR